MEKREVGGLVLKLHLHRKDADFTWAVFLAGALEKVDSNHLSPPSPPFPTPTAPPNTALCCQ